MILPAEAASILAALAPAFTAPTFRRFCLLLLGAILTPGRRTVANLLRTLGPLAAAHRTTYQRVLSSARWYGLRLACPLCRLVVRLLPAEGPITLVGDDTVDGHKGKQVYGKARHRDPVRSSHSYTAWRYGHKWVVLAALVPVPGASRPWALPLLVDLYRSEEDNRRLGKPHRTPAQLMCRLLAILARWFPARRFVFVGDAGYGSHEVARFCHAQPGGRLTLVSKLHPEANLFTPPPPYAGNGRPRVKGERLPKPSQAVGQARRRRRLTVRWYGGGTRRVEVVGGAGQWYKAGQGLVPVRWVFVHDLTGTHRDEYFFTTDTALGAAALIGYYASRWNIETTFQELRAHLGLETTRGWCRRTVLRAAPCLFGLYTVVTLLFLALPEDKRSGSVSWPGKAALAFSDALTSVRRWLWAEWVIPQAGAGSGLEILPAPLRNLLLAALAPAP
jgi:DDE superfamily endonuclease